MGLSDQEREQLLSQGTAWMLENELINSPQVKNFLILNTYQASPNILLTELLLQSQLKVIMIYLELNFIGRLLRRQKAIEQYLLEEYKRVLPSFKVRVVYDRKIFDMALVRAQKLAEGSLYVKSTSELNTSSTNEPTSSRDDLNQGNLDTPATEIKKEPEGS